MSRWFCGRVHASGAALVSKTGQPASRALARACVNAMFRGFGRARACRMRQSRLEDAGMPWVVLRFALILVALSALPAPHVLAQDKPWRIGFLSGGLPPVP